MGGQQYATYGILEITLMLGGFVNRQIGYNWLEAFM